ncbi:hypothetical protein FOCC_FOCC012576 [Frankliniella occidentalis]|uniref:Uncharacterized protein LOC127750415 n=1 Tax=Frankliniella occidentalis TaxID=133901 RepID=A0A9C6X2N3_FRAOC|nr:uncharacterized protein LOC127750415 [Frankliniella occidentalis]KAE8741924.1 hypothetical protein FOCC_FOCC012576 [Frankliniella occidentalis]
MVKDSRGGARCTFPHCTTVGGRGISLYRYPKDPNLRAVWLQLIGRPDYVPYDGARLCELHFSPSVRSRRGLLPGAVPLTVRLPVPDPVCSCKVRSFSAPLRDHPYASLNSESCKVHGHLVRVRIVSELEDNCSLLEEFHKLKRLQAQNVNVKPVPKIKFSSADIKKGLQLWLACGTSGYKKVIEFHNTKETRLPAIRTLQAATQHLKFAPGILEEVMVPLKAKFQGYTNDNDRDINIVFDEFMNKKQIDYDPSLKRMFGYCTLPGQQHMLAEKTELYVFRSVHQRLKQIVAYQQNPKESADEAKKDFIIKLLEKAHEIGANVISLVCDMGNRGVLSKLGFCTQMGKERWCIPNPVTGAKLWVSPDPVHIFKSVKEGFTKQGTIIIPKRIKEEFGLPSREVNLDHILWLEAFQRGDTLQLMPGLTFKDIVTSHFSKMNVRAATKIFNSRLAAVLKYLSVRGIVPKEFETTAWFLKLMNRWFQLMCSRNLQFALGHRNEAAYEEAIEHLGLVICVFRHSQIPSGWKPYQSNIIVATKAMLEIQRHLLDEKKYQFIQTAAFSTDCNENINSQVRLSCPNPTPLEAKNRIKQITISQFSMDIKSSSYNFDGCEDFVDMLLRPNEPTEPSFDLDFDWSTIKWTDTVPVSAAHENDVLYRISGYIIITLMKKKQLKCQSCVSALEHPDKDPHPNSLLLHLMDFVPGAQFAVIDVLFQMFKLIEYNLREWIPQIKHLERLDCLIQSVVQPGTAHIQLPTCHDVKEKLVKTFTIMRFRQLAVTELSPEEKNTASSLASKSTGGHYLASNFGTPVKRTPFPKQTSYTPSPLTTQQQNRQNYSTVNTPQQTQQNKETPLKTPKQNLHLTPPATNHRALPSQQQLNVPLGVASSSTPVRKPPNVFLKRIINLP